MRRACLFLLLVIGWSILLMMRDGNGWNDKLLAPQALAMTIECIPMTEEECISTDGIWNSTDCCCEYPDPGCDPVEQVLCESDPLCTWDDILCECNCIECGPPQEHWTGSLTIGPYDVCEDGVPLVCITKIDYYETVNCYGIVISTREEAKETCEEF
jgi:hypothetical protein